MGNVLGSYLTCACVLHTIRISKVESLPGGKYMFTLFLLFCFLFVCLFFFFSLDWVRRQRKYLQTHAHSNNETFMACKTSIESCLS